MRCDHCAHWEPSLMNKHFLPADFIGRCTGMPDYDHIEIEVRGDGYIHSIGTKCSFFCGCFEGTISEEEIRGLIAPPR